MSASVRHHGIDWLRIAAFGLLIVYHAGMVFAPWAWVVKWPKTTPALIVPMALLTPWRLPLLFAVSGFATRTLIARPGFVAQRTVRLLVPLAFALLVLLPPELWVRARQAGYAGGLTRYWLVDGWAPGRFPEWEHLWFVVYLWSYTMLLAALPRPGRWQAATERWLGGGRMLWLPVAALAGARVVLMFLVPERHTLAGDWEGHALYLPLFLFGVALGGSPALWREARGHARAAGALAAAAAAVVVATELAYPGTRVPPHGIAAAERAAQAAMAWAMVVALLALADRWAERQAGRDHRWRAPLARAVFPAYLVHQPVIVCSTWLLLPTGIGALPAFVLILAATSLACAAAVAAGQRVGWLGPLLGLPAQTRRTPLTASG